MESGIAAIALGSNLGDREQNLRSALGLINPLGSIEAVSSFLDTAPVEFFEQPRFLNAALLLRTTRAPLDLLAALLEIERVMGRDRATVPAKGPRIIDLDLIFLGEQVMVTPMLTLPHPAMQNRAFVLEPLAEIAPGWRHPVLARTIEELLSDLQTGSGE